MLYLPKADPRAQKFRTWKCLFCPSRNRRKVGCFSFLHETFDLTSTLKSIYIRECIHTLVFDVECVSYTPPVVMDHADQFFVVSLFYFSYTLLKACANKQKKFARALTRNRKKWSQCFQMQK